MTEELPHVDTKTKSFRLYDSIKSLIIFSVGCELKSPIKRKFSYLNENESRLFFFILFKRFSIVDLCWLYNLITTFSFWDLFQWILHQLFLPNLLLKVLKIYLLRRIIGGIISVRVTIKFARAAVTRNDRIVH